MNKSHGIMMQSSKSKTSRAVSRLELKQRVLLSLNKLSDRDTHQIGVQDLEKIANGLTTQEGIALFVSCIIDTDSEQKTAVRKECIKLMATIARFHASHLVAPHLGKMMASIVKRLKDTDSVVRDACVETAGVLATSGAANDAPGFITIVKPLFEALGEQSRYVQTGSALCLARVIDGANHPPTLLLSQMMIRVVKLLKNPHFLAKPAVIDLIRSIVQAGGASTEHALSTAVTSILETLKSSDWTARKAASVALAGMAVSAARPFLGSFRTSCIRSLESCRFDKVKPVRDSIMHALQCWKSLPGIGSTEPSEAGSSTKENMNGDYSDVASVSGSRWREMSCKKASPLSAANGTTTSNVTSKKQIPSASFKTCPNYVQNHYNHPSSNDWHIEISLPKSHTLSPIDALAFERASNAKYDYEAAEDKVECSSMSDLVSGSFETKHVTIDEGDSSTLIGFNHRSVTEEVDIEGPVLTQDRKSLDSTVTDMSSRGTHECCLHAASELSFIKKQLVEIETKQSNLLDLLQVFVRNSGDNMLTIQMKVHSLEHAVDKIMKNISQNGNYSSNMTSTKFMKNNKSVTSSPRLSTTTPRPSVESNFNKSNNSSSNKEVWGVNSSSRCRSSTSATKEGTELWRDPTLNIVRNRLLQNDERRSVQANTSSSQLREINRNASSVKQGKLEVNGSLWKQIKESLHSGDMESAYAEALCTGDDLCLFELMHITGPVLERLSCETSAVILGILTTHFVNQRFMDSIIPWFLQLVDISNDCEPRRLVMSSKTRLDFLYALRELTTMECIDQIDRTAVIEYATKLTVLWGEAPTRDTSLKGHVLRTLQHKGAICNEGNIENAMKSLCSKRIPRKQTVN